MKRAQKIKLKLYFMLSLFRRWEAWRFISYGLVHVGYLHLLSNCLVYWYLKLPGILIFTMLLVPFIVHKLASLWKVWKDFKSQKKWILSPSLHSEYDFYLVKPPGAADAWGAIGALLWQCAGWNNFELEIVRFVTDMCGIYILWVVFVSFWNCWNLQLHILVGVWNLPGSVVF